MLVDLNNGSISFKTPATEKSEAVPTIFQHVPQPKAWTQPLNANTRLRELSNRNARRLVNNE